MACTVARADGASDAGSRSVLTTSVKFGIAVCAIGRYISVTASRLSDTCRTSSTTPTMRNQEPESKPAVVRTRRSIGLVVRPEAAGPSCG